MLVLILSTLLVCCCIYWITARPTKFPPGPIGFPIMGYLPLLEKDVHLQMAKYSQQYGDVFGLRFGSFWVVMLSSVTAVREAFKEEAFSGRPDFPFSRIISDDKKGIIFNDGNNWQELRRFTLRNLRDFGLGKSSLDGLIQDEIRELINSLQTTSEKPIQLVNRFNLATVNALWTLISGQRFSHDDPKAIEYVEGIRRMLADSSNSSPTEFMPFLSRFYPWKKNISERVQNTNPLSDLVTKTLKSYRDSHVEGNESDLIQSFLEIMHKNADTGSQFGKVAISNLKNIVFDLLLAGTETTSTSLLWFVFLMASYPEIQEKIHREIDTHVPVDELPSSGHRKKLTYIEATIRESMRYATLVPLGVFHSTLHDTKFRGYIIPKGTILSANLYQIHHDPKYWEKPDEFYPEHFLNPDGSLKTPEAFMPFAVGKRACLGESLARMELFSFTTALLQKFKFIFPSDRPTPSLEPTGSRVLYPRSYDIIILLR